MASKGKANNIVNDFKVGLIGNKQPKEAKKLDKLIKYLGHYDQDKLVLDLQELGYNVQADYLTRPTQVEEIMFNKSDQLIDLLESQYDQIKESLRVFGQDSNNLGCISLLAITLGGFFGIVTIAYNAFTSGGKDNSVFTYASFPNVDTDTTSIGTLSLKAVPNNPDNMRATNLKYLKELKLVVITQEPKKGKLRLIFDDSELKPFQIIGFETKGIINDASTIIDLPLTVKEVKWEIDK
jgi:hypothetical protein